MYICTCTQQQLVKKEVTNLKESREKYPGGFNGGEGREKRCDYVMISKIKRKNDLFL